MRIAFLLLAGAVSAAPSSAAEPFSAAEHAKTVRPFLTKYCLQCHGSNKQEGGLRVDRLPIDFAANSPQSEQWLEAMNQISSGTMPPEDVTRRPTAEEIAAVRTWIGAALEHSIVLSKDGAGEVVLRRLNRTEYNNTIRDVFGVDMKIANDFPEDDQEGGFDNNGQALNLSSVLMDRYLAAAKRIVNRCFPDGEAPEPVRYEFSGANNNLGVAARHNQFQRVRQLPCEVGVKLGDPGLYRFTFTIARWAPDESKPTIFELTKGLEESSEYITSFSITADEYAPQTVVYEQIFTPKDIANIPRRGYRFRPKDGGKDNGDLLIQSVVVEGPVYDVWPSPAFVECFPKNKTDGNVDDMTRLVAKFGAKIYRRPITDGDLAPLKAVYNGERKAGGSHLAAMREVFTYMLVNPSFLYLLEEDRGPAPLDDYELANRLSYFLWSSAPDDELYRLAAAGKLREAAVLDAQVERLLADPRSASFVDNLVGQWLAQRRIDEFSVDTKQFKNWDGQLREAMVGETRAFFNEILRQNLSSLNLLDSDWAMLNERLATFYGIPGVSGAEFRKVQLPKNSRRGGLITQASMMKILSDGIDSKPMKRSAWVLENLLADPPPPPPKDVDTAAVMPKKGQAPATLRARLEIHRQNPACYSCHSKIDPIGFGLESYDAIGGWRDTDANQLPIDTSGRLPGGASFSDAQGLKKALLGQKDDFCRCITEKFLVYGLGRSLVYSDRDAVEALAKKMPSHGYTMKGLIQDIVRSEIFRKP